MASIPIADVITTERLPIDAQDIITKVRLVIAGNVAGPQAPETVRCVDDNYALGSFGTGNNVETVPYPIVLSRTVPEHATYGAERSFALPEGTNPFLEPTDDLVGEPTIVSNFSNPGTPSAIRDGDPLTYAELTGSGSSQISYFGALSPEAVGFKLRYSLTGDPIQVGGPSTFFRFLSDGGSVVRTLVSRRWRLPMTQSLDEPTDTYAISLYDARGADANLGDGWERVASFTLSLVANSSTQMRVYAYYPLILNVPLLDDIAKANIRLPAANPTRVTVNGIVAPDRSHTIVGWPGGDYTAPVAQHQYELGRTIIDFEQAGAPTGLPAEAIEAARERTVAVKSEIQRSGYSLKMGERQ